MLHIPKRWIIILFVWLIMVVPVSYGESYEQMNSEVVNKVQVVPEQPIVRLAMTAAFVSQAGLEVYEHITNYLSGKTGQEFEFVTDFSYSTINAMLEDGAINFGFVCGLPYVIKSERALPTVELVVAPIMKLSHYNNKPKYFSYVIVRNDSKYESFADLKGCVYVYNDKISNCGYNMPRARLIELEETDGFFDKVIRSGSHEESIRMVALGMADASSVDSLVFDYDIARNPEYASQVKIIEKLGPVGIPPLVSSTLTDPEIVRKVQKILLEMNNDPQGRIILDESFINRFEEVDDSNYDDIRRMKKLAEDARFLEIK